MHFTQAPRFQPRSGSVAAALLGGLLLCVGASGCRVTRPEAAGTHVATGDVLSGRLPPQVPTHAFTFEGVESSLLDFTLQSDELNRTSPNPVLIDPDGQPVDLVGHRISRESAATARYQGVVLLRTGTYRLSLESADPSADSWYLYEHALRFPSIVDDRASLTSATPHPVSFSAPYGATVSVRIRPVNRSNLLPDIHGVRDPSGGRALDATQTPQGVQPPQMAPTLDGGLLLMFVAPRAGRYTVLAAAKPGREGEAAIDVDVRVPNFNRNVWHPGSEQGTPLSGMTAPAPGPARASVPVPPPPAPAARGPLPVGQPTAAAPPAGGFPRPSGDWSQPAPLTTPAEHIAQK